MKMQDDDRQPSIMPLFAIPVYIGNVDVTDKERDVIVNKLMYVDNYGGVNERSNDTWLHRSDQEDLVSLHQKIYEHINKFIYDVCDVVKEVQPVIIGSWASRIKPKGSHPKHSHPNSHFSGVLYINTPSDTPEQGGSIVFYKDPMWYNLFSPTAGPNFNNLNPVNSPTSSYHPKQGDIIIFPSHLEHSVSESNCSDDRYSVAFDFALQGDFTYPNKMMGTYKHTNMISIT